MIDPIGALRNLLDRLGLKTSTASSGVLKGTDNAIALLKQAVTQSGMWFFGDVTTYTDANNFASLDLAGREANFFYGWYVLCVRDDGGGGLAPQGDNPRLVTAYVSATGGFTHNAFSANMAVGDQVVLIAPALYEILTIRGGANTIQDVVDNQQAMLDLAEYPTNSVVCDGNEQTVYEKTGVTVPYYFGGGFIDWTGANFGAGEDTTVKVYVKVDGTNYRVAYQETFLAAALPVPVVTPFPRAVNTACFPDDCTLKQDVKVTIQQAAVGAGWNTLDVRTIDGQRGA